MNSKRLLNVAKALRESKSPGDFTMARYAHDCGTPACAFGHYASREDLQDIFRLQRSGCVVYAAHADVADFDDEEAIEHFGISFGEAQELFAHNGCNEAQTPIEAAEYIERFVARHSVR